MGRISTSELGSLLVEHHVSLPTRAGRTSLLRHWPWVVMFLIFPAGGAAAVAIFGHLSSNVTAGLLAGIGVLGGLLFQVLAWVSGRIATLADSMGARKATSYELGLVRRLDIARANIAYATFVSLVFVAGLGFASMLDKTPRWMNGVFAFLLFHLSVTLVLVLLRINRIGKNDRVSALTAHAREHSDSPVDLV